MQIEFGKFLQEASSLMKISVIIGTSIAIITLIYYFISSKIKTGKKKKIHQTIILTQTDEAGKFILPHLFLKAFYYNI